MTTQLHVAPLRRNAAPAAGPAPAPGRPQARRPVDTDLVATVHAAAAGHDGAWSDLVCRFDRMLRGIARSYRLGSADVDDAVQATWLHLFGHIDRLRAPAAIGGWLATTVRRECLRLLQVPVREQLTDDRELGDGEQSGPETQLLAAERSAALEQALATLPERHRRLMTLLASDAEPDYQRISEKLAMPIGSIGPIRARSLARLQRCPQMRAVRPDAA